MLTEVAPQVRRKRVFGQVLAVNKGVQRLVMWASIAFSSGMLVMWRP